MELSISTLDKITNLFEELQWEIEDQNDNDYSLYIRFCTLMSYLSDQEQELIIELTKKQYLRVKFEEYNTLIETAFKNALENSTKDLKKVKKLYVIPLLAPEDRGKIKSSTVVAYIFQNVEFQYKKLFKSMKIQVMHELNKKMINKINENEEALLLIVDDFVGTGETAISCLEDVCIKQGVKMAKVIVLSLVAQEIGVNSVNSFGVEMFTAFTRKRGISDYYKGDFKKYINIMKGIEEKLQPSEKYQLGYLGSESLVSMIRTPNNTFPIYWLTKGKYKDTVPFPRW